MKELTFSFEIDPEPITDRELSPIYQQLIKSAIESESDSE